MNQILEQLISAEANNSVVPQGDADKLIGTALEKLEFADAARAALFVWIRTNLVHRKSDEFDFERQLTDYDRQFIWFNDLEYGCDFPEKRLYIFEKASAFIGRECLGERCANRWLIKSMPRISTDVNWSSSGSPFDELATSGSVSRFYDMVLHDVDVGSLSVDVFVRQFASVVENIHLRPWQGYRNSLKSLLLKCAEKNSEVFDTQSELDW